MSDQQPVLPPGAPQVTDGHRLLGVVPGTPPGGDSKQPADQDLVMVAPHLLVRHGVAAIATALVVLLISVFFDAPLQRDRQSNPHPEPGEGAVVFRRSPGVARTLPPTDRRSPGAGGDRDGPDGTPLH